MRREGQTVHIVPSCKGMIIEGKLLEWEEKLLMKTYGLWSLGD